MNFKLKDVITDFKLTFNFVIITTFTNIYPMPGYFLILLVIFQHYFTPLQMIILICSKNCVTLYLMYQPYQHYIVYLLDGNVAMVDTPPQ